MFDRLLLDMSGILDEETFHEYVSKKLNFPGHYSYNLDAFWDYITDDEQSSMPRKIEVEGMAALKIHLPVLHDSFVECLQDYVKVYPNRDMVFRQDSPSGEGLEFEGD
ncbi:barstar family protein [Enterovibrio sp. ZSDZ42]|uniref:Barstar family protein n=1 Tax=Enterovibrio gelatinilyticus TaxID=2899819 RepID=A0ABT5R2N6_9GAMM|nr:barstar family protein [Enterovibrio sp. ZSDZ42]MDD1794430.1 barstar family protein [Enterovibrio sp. ZSDZ42]